MEGGFCAAQHAVRNPTRVGFARHPAWATLGKICPWCSPAPPYPSADLAMSPSPYALVLDDHPLVARGVAEFLRSRLPRMEVAVAGRTEDVMPLVAERGAPAIALIDFWLAEGAALDLIAQLRQHCPGSALAVISGDDDPAVMERVRKAGAHGFIHKQA
eukprot:gene35713-58712_t